MITKEKKTQLIKDIEAMLKSAASIVFVKFDKLTVKDANALRRGLDKENVAYKVSKKTLLKRVLDTKGFEGSLPDLEGEIAIAASSDPLSAAREVYAFQSAHKDNISIVGGVFDGKYQDKAQMISIATIPPLQTLRGMFVNIINSPIQRLVIGLNAVAGKKSA